VTWRRGFDTDFEAEEQEKEVQTIQEKITSLFCLSGSLNPILKDDTIDRSDESPSIFEENVTDKVICRPQEKFLNFSR